MEHRHIFIHQGGGCGMPAMETYDPDKCCDDDYKCECGEKFRVYGSMTAHRYLPERFESEPMSELKAAEQEAIDDAFLNPGKSIP